VRRYITPHKARKKALGCAASKVARWKKPGCLQQGALPTRPPLDAAHATASPRPRHFNLCRHSCASSMCATYPQWQARLSQPMRRYINPGNALYKALVCAASQGGQVVNVFTHPGKAAARTCTETASILENYINCGRPASCNKNMSPRGHLCMLRILQSPQGRDFCAGSCVLQLCAQPRVSQQWQARTTNPVRRYITPHNALYKAIGCAASQGGQVGEVPLLAEGCSFHLATVE
jgi:hypothetical protein